MTLQEHYNAIKNGKGNKSQFLKQARHLFPQYINQYSDFDSATNVLKSKQIISEAAGGVVSKGFDIWDWKKILAEETKSVEKNTSKEVTDRQAHAYDNKDMKNADNVNFNEIMKGFYAELRDEKNNGKTGDEIKAMVVKNLAKDPLYYTKNGEFGTKGVGYTTEAPGLGEPKEPKGKHKSSGYGDLDTDTKQEKPKANVQDSLGDKEAKTSNPSKVKEMEVTPQNSPGVKKMPMPGAEKKIKLQEEIKNKTYAVYELEFGQPYNFYNEEQDKFIWGEPTKATLYTKEEAEIVRKKLLKPRVDYYQRTGKNYEEIYVGDLFKKGILKEEEIKWERQSLNEDMSKEEYEQKLEAIVAKYVKDSAGIDKEMKNYSLKGFSGFSDVVQANLNRDTDYKNLETGRSKMAEADKSTIAPEKGAKKKIDKGTLTQLLKYAKEQGSDPKTIKYLEDELAKLQENTESVKDQQLRSLIQQIIKEELEEISTIGAQQRKVGDSVYKDNKEYKVVAADNFKITLKPVEGGEEFTTTHKDVNTNYTIFYRPEKELKENKYAKSFLDAIKPTGLDINADPESSEFTDLEDAAYDFIRRSDIEDLRPEELVFAARAYAKK